MISMCRHSPLAASRRTVRLPRQGILVHHALVSDGDRSQDRAMRCRATSRDTMTSTSQIATAPHAPLPGLDGLRLLGAVSVLFSHSYLIAAGSEEAEPLVRLLGPNNIFGLYG